MAVRKNYTSHFKGMLRFPKTLLFIHPQRRPHLARMSKARTPNGKLTEAGSSLMANTDGKGRSQKWMFSCQENLLIYGQARLAKILGFPCVSAHTCAGVHA